MLLYDAHSILVYPFSGPRPRMDSFPHEDDKAQTGAHISCGRILDFIQTTRYQRPLEGVPHTDRDGSSYILAPQGWEVHRHPNGDIYFYNRELQLITPDDVTGHKKLSRVMESYDDHMRNMEYDRLGRQLGDDWELILSYVTKSSVMIEMISRNTGKACTWSDNRGLQMLEDEAHYWSLLAEYPSHHPDLPPGVEAEFVKKIHAAKTAVEQGRPCPLTLDQIGQVINRYQELKVAQAEGKNVTPPLAWLMGVVMPLSGI